MFAKVAEERSFAAAARTMGVSVATVSRAVTRLEERLGGRLFNRTSRRLALTDYGHMLAERATKIYAEAEEAEDFARETSSRPRGLVKLAAPLTFGARWVAPLLPEFFRTYSDISVDLHLTDAHADLIGDGFDAALRIAILETHRLSRAWSLLCVGLLWRPQLICLATAGHSIRTTLVRISVLPTQTEASGTSGALPTKAERSARSPRQELCAGQALRLSCPRFSPDLRSPSFPSS